MGYLVQRMRRYAQPHQKYHPERNPGPWVTLDTVPTEGRKEAKRQRDLCVALEARHGDEAFEEARPFFRLVQV